MICPNCKTELVEVNGRFICSDCGREIPENEVMASDWGNGGTARAGLYGAGTDETPETPEEGSKPITDYESSLTESENELVAAAEAVASETTTPEAEPEVVATPVPEAAPDTPPAADTGFYTPEAVVSTPEVITEPVVTTEAVATSVPTPEIPTVPAPEVQEIPITVPETSAAASLPQDPGIYTDPMYENTPTVEAPVAAVTPVSAPMPVSKKTNLIVIISGIVLVVLLITGGTWAYFSLNAKVSPVTPTPTPEVSTWQEFQSVDGGFKITFPGQPETSDQSMIINTIENPLKTYIYSKDNTVYMASYAVLADTQAQTIKADLATTLPILANEVAKEFDLTITDKKIGTYFTADAIDITMGSDTAKYQGKIMLLGNKYILVLAGDDSGKTVEYDKFIKSFSFISTGTAE